MNNLNNLIMRILNYSGEVPAPLNNYKGKGK